MTVVSLVLLGGARPSRAEAPASVRAVSAEKKAASSYRWNRRAEGYHPLSGRLAPPPGFERVAVRPGSYADWLRGLPLMPPASPVRSYRGRTILRAGHPAVAAVVDLDVGRRDRQQCVDTIIRLRGEYLYAAGRARRVRFAWAGGLRFGFAQWQRGLRPVRHGRRWTFARRARASSGYRSFRRYLSYMFAWTGSIHQGRERRVAPDRLRAGDFFVQPGSPGHAVVVLDVARAADGRRAVLLGQGFMPAQDLHVLRASSGSAWFALDRARPLRTPLWPRPFRWAQLRRFRD